MPGIPVWANAKHMAKSMVPVAKGCRRRLVAVRVGGIMSSGKEDFRPSKGGCRLPENGRI